MANLESQISDLKSKKGGTWVQRWRVPLGFACAVVFFLLAKPRPFTLLIGALVAIPGLALRAWATGHLRKNEKLATTGPYAYTRNPLYLGSFLVGLGFTIAAARGILLLLFLAMVIGIYVPVMRVESDTLARLFGAPYQHYAQNVPMLWPRFSAYEEGAANNFDGTLYLRYREYRAALGAVGAWAILALKWILFR